MAQTSLEGRKILVVEDSLDNQEIFQYFLEGAGARVQIAKSGFEALEMAETFDPDLILMDIQIPDLDGREVTRQLRNRGDSRPIVALTAHALNEEKELCLQAGCNGQISKPVSSNELIRQVSEYLH